MTLTKNEHGLRSVGVTVLSAITATIAATGILITFCAIAAAVQGTTLIEFYVQHFPVFRGAHPAAPMPFVVYAIFVVYVLCAVEIALRIRRRWGMR